jgi:hypothetical protein
MLAAGYQSNRTLIEVVETSKLGELNCSLEGLVEIRFIVQGFYLKNKSLGLLSETNLS